MPSNSPAPTLDHLHDIIVGEPVSWMPQTVGWAALGVVLVLVLFRVGYILVQRWKANRYRRLALEQLQQIERSLQNPDGRPAALLQLPVLLKQVVLARWQRTEVASLTGESWLRFLDESYDGQGFTQGPGRLLPRLAYSPPSTLHGLLENQGDEVKGLVMLIRTWIRQHHV